MIAAVFSVSVFEPPKKKNARHICPTNAFLDAASPDTGFSMLISVCWRLILRKVCSSPASSEGGDNVGVCAIRSNILSVEERTVGKYSEGNICVFLKASAKLQNSLFF